MKKYILSLIILFSGLGLGLYMSIAHPAFGDTLSVLPGMLYNQASNFVYPRVNNAGLQLPSQAGTGGCAFFDGSGNLLGGSACSGGGGGSASTTINGLKPATGNFTFNGSTTADSNITLSVSTTSPGTINLIPGWNGQLAVSRGGTGTNTLASLTVGTNLSISGGQNVLIGTSTQISLGPNVVTTLATGTSGSIFNGSIGSNTLTLNLPFASGSNTGQLQAADWTTFNNKQAALSAGANILITGTTVSSNTFTQTVCPSGSSVTCNQTGNGSSDQTAINSAITAAGTNGTVVLKSGTYNLSGAINMASGVTLMCDGDGTTINTNTTTSQSIYFNGVTNSSLIGCHIHDITPDSLGFGITSYRQVELLNSHNIKIERNTLDNSSGYAIYSQSGAANSTTDVSIINNFVQVNGHQDAIGGGPNVQGNSTTSGFSIIGNHIYNKVGNGTIGSNVDNNCIDMVATLNLTITGNDCYGNIYLSSEKVPDQAVIISNNNVHPSTGATSTAGSIGINQKTGGIATATPQWLSITGNTLSGGTIAFEGSPTSSIEQIIVSGNTIHNAAAGAQGVDALPAGYGIYGDYIKNSTFADNIISASTSSAASTVGIKLTANTSNITSSSNTFKDYVTALDFGSVASNLSKWDNFINVGTNFSNVTNAINLSSSGNLLLGTADFGYRMTTLTSNPSIAYFGTSGHNNANVVFDTNGGPGFNSASIIFQDAGVNQWTLKGHDNAENFVIASSSGTSALTINQNSSTTLVGLILGNVQSGTQCLHALSSGQVVGTGSDCGAGGGGSGTISTSTTAIIGHEANWTGLATLGNGAWLDNGTVVGFNATSSTIGVNIQGTGGTNDIFNLASSSGTSMLKVSANNNILFQNEATPTLPAGTQKFFTVLGSQAGGIMQVTRDAGTGILPNTLYGTYVVDLYTASTTLPDLTGPTQLFTYSSSTTRNTIADFGGRRDGADNTGDLLLRPYQNGGANGSLILAGNSANPFMSITSQNGANTIVNVASSSGTTLFQVNSQLTAATVYIQGLPGQSPNILNVSSSTASAIMVVTSNGRVGIGSATPTSILTVQGSSGSTTNLFTVSSSTNTSLFTVLANGNVGIGSSTPNQKLAVDGNIALTNNGTTVTSAAKELILEETGDDFGASRLHLQNRSGANGAVFEDPVFDLVDFIFQPATGITASQNIRFEYRGGAMKGNANKSGTAGEFQLGRADNPNFVTGQGTTLIKLGNLEVGGTTTATSLFSLQDSNVTGSALFTLSSSTGSSILNVSNAGFIGINTSTGTSLLTLQGNSGQSNSFLTFASSTGSTLYQVNNLGIISNYNGITTAGLGVPAIYGAGRVVATTTAITNLGSYTVGSSDGSFEISANVLVTTSTVHNFTVTCSYTDEGNTARTLTLQFSNLSGTLLTAIANAAGAVPYEGVPLHIRAKAGTSISFNTTGTFTTVTYNLDTIIKQTK